MDSGSLIHRSEHSDSNLIDLSHSIYVSMMQDSTCYPSTILMENCKWGFSLLSMFVDIHNGQ